MPSPRLSPKAARLLGLQFLLTAVAIVAGVLFVIWNSRANRMGTTGGIDPIHTAITWIALSFIGICLGYVTTNFARQLMSEAKGTRRGVESW